MVSYSIRCDYREMRRAGYTAVEAFRGETLAEQDRACNR